MECRRIEDGTSTKTTLRNFGVQIGKVAGLGTDGGSVMASDMNGLRGLMGEEN